jgi:hypothetical protein
VRCAGALGMEGQPLVGLATPLGCTATWKVKSPLRRLAQEDRRGRGREAFAKLKALRRAGTRTREALIETTARTLDIVTAGDARGFFEHCCYRATVHLLRHTL